MTFPHPSEHPFTPMEFGSTSCRWCSYHRRAHEEEIKVNLSAADAIVAARKVDDLTRKEWNDLYLSKNPWPAEVDAAARVAREVLVRKGIIGEEVQIQT